jgi:hypothetical protein
MELLAEYPAPGLESELAGVHPHPTDDDLYFVAANKRPVYGAGQTPVLPARYRGKLLTLNRHTGTIVRAVDLTDGDYGGIAYGDNHLFISSLDPPEILKVDPGDGRIVDRIPISGPAGGLEYDKDRSLLLAQLFIRHPHLAVIDPKTRATIDILESDESAMGLSKVQGDWLCTWVSGPDAHAFSEMRRIDGTTGKVTGRIRLEGIYTSLAPLDKKVAGTDGFISLVKVDPVTGKVTVRRHRYNRAEVAW